MRKLAIAIPLLGVCLFASAALGATPILRFDDVRAGMKGVGRTVFDGTEIVTFEVEILGTLRNVGPDQNLILGRCSGGPLARTGVLAGMSGSPVTVDGKLIGAVAYSWGFSKEPIAGITPIEQMLEIASLGGAPPGASGLSRTASTAEWRVLSSADELESFFDRAFGALLPRAGIAPVSIPLSLSGFGPRGLAHLEPRLREAGFVPLQAGRSGSAAGVPPPIEPGSAVGLKLVRGDIEIAATGTATWVDGERVLAFGHPMFGLGEVDLPLSAAEVQVLLPSLYQSARLATPLGDVGALRQDRASGVLGVLGAAPRTIPVRLQLGSAEVGERAYSFDVADDPLLSPLLLYVSLNGILTSRERAVGNVTLRLREGSVIKMASGQDVELDNVFSGPTASLYGTGVPAYVLHLLMNNTWSPPQIAGINLMLDYENMPRTAQIRRASLDRYRVRPGETVQAAVHVRPYRGRDRVLTRDILIPDETPPGTLTVDVGGALSVSRAEEQAEPVLPRDLDQLVTLINQLRRNDRIYIVATREDSGVLLNGARLPNLPPSATAVLSRPKSRGNYRVVPRRSVLEESIPTDLVVQGWARLEVEVEAK